MEPLEVAQAYFDAWNLRGPAEVAATFAPGGTYADPTTGQPLSGQAIVEYTSGLASFGSSGYVSQGDCSKPGTFNMTSISLHSDEEAQEVSGGGAGSSGKWPRCRVYQHCDCQSLPSYVYYVSLGIRG